MNPIASGMPSRYRITVKGTVNRSIVSLVSDLEIFPQENGETILIGTFIDQPALRGLLNWLWNLNATILSIEKIDEANDPARVIPPH